MMEFGTAIILAGGKGERMGFDKQLIVVNGEPLVRTTIAKLRALFDDIVVVSGRKALYDGLGVTVVGDEFPGGGPLAGIHAGLKGSRSDYAYVMACDMPTVNEPFVRHMMRRLGGGTRDACVARYKDWIEPFNAFYSKKLAARMEEYLRKGETAKPSINFFVENSDALFIGEDEARAFSPDWAMFGNLNTPYDLERHVSAAAGERGRVGQNH